MEHFCLILSRLQGSFSQMKKISVLSCSAMLTGVAVILQLFTIPISDLIQVNFLFVPIAMAGAMFGPVSSGLVAVAADILKFLIRPTGGFFPGFTLTALVTGLVYGISFYRRKPGLLRIVLTQLFLDVFAHIGLNTLWLVIMYNKAAAAILPMRAVKTLIVLPIEVLFLVLAMKVSQKVSARVSPGRQ